MAVLTEVTGSGRTEEPKGTGDVYALLYTPHQSASEGPVTGLVARGILWAGSSQVGQQVVQLIVTIILARLLSPTDFGLVAMLVVFTGFLQLFVDAGLGAALVQRSHLSVRHLETAFWLNVAAGLGLAAVFAASSPGLAALYGQPRLRMLGPVLAVEFLIASFSIVQLALFQRSMNFRRIALSQNSAVVLGGALGITVALRGGGVWSLVVETLVTTLARTVILWLMSAWRPRARFSRTTARDLWAFSAHLLGFTSINYWSRNLDNFLIGRVVGARGLGIYERAYDTMLLPQSQVTTVIGQVLFPALSRLQHDRSRLRAAYLRAIGVLALVTFPISIGLVVVARPFVLAVFGPKWAEAIVILQILGVPAVTQTIGASTSLIYQACARTDLLFKWGVAAAVVTVAAFGVGINWGIRGVAWAYTARTLLLLYFNYSIPGRLIGMSFADVVKAVIGPLGASAIMAGTVLLARHELPALSPTPLLLVEVSVGVIAYAGAALMLHLAAWDHARAALRSLLHPTSALA